MESPRHQPGTRAVVDLGGVAIGGSSFVVIAGPCAVESREGLLAIARGVAAAGAGVLRGGAWKPRTSPRSFQGLGQEGLEHLRAAREATGLPVITELVDPRDAEALGEAVDIVQVGARNMQNAALLRAAGELGKPVLLKRNMGSTIDELLAAADYLFDVGNDRIVLCERGIRTFETSTRYTLDLSAVPVLRERTHLPIVVDPSHAAGRRELVPDLARAAAAVGADGVMVEVHDIPDDARSDGAQSLHLRDLAPLVGDLDRVVEALGRHRAAPSIRTVA